MVQHQKSHVLKSKPFRPGVFVTYFWRKRQKKEINKGKENRASKVNREKGRRKERQQERKNDSEN